MQHQRVPVRVLEERHVADARVERLAVEDDALRLELGTPGGDIAHVDREMRGIGAELDAGARRIPDAQAELADEDFEPGRRVPVERQPERVHVEPLRTCGVLRLDCEEIDLLDLHRYPTEPSICSWISRFISTAYSSGSSFVIGSTKPLTIIADASASESPRDIR